jgi:hypothetical protein
MIKFQVNEKGEPEVLISSEQMWEFVEFLSYQRAPVHYTFSPSNQMYQATISRRSREQVEQLLRDFEHQHFAGV